MVRAIFWLFKNLYRTKADKKTLQTYCFRIIFNVFIAANFFFYAGSASHEFDWCWHPSALKWLRQIYECHLLSVWSLVGYSSGRFAKTIVHWLRCVNLRHFRNSRDLLVHQCFTHNGLFSMTYVIYIFGCGLNKYIDFFSFHNCFSNSAALAI